MIENTPVNPNSWVGKIACQYVHSNLRLDTTQVKTSVNSYVYALFERGSAQIKFDNHVITAKEGDFLIFPPHIHPVPISVSPDYEAICLIVSSSFIYDSPVVRNVCQTATFSLLSDSDPIIPLPEDFRQNIRETFQMMMRHIKNTHQHTLEALQSLFGLLLADVLAVIDTLSDRNTVNPHSYHHFIEFNKLLRKNFREHHEITFYADQLNISPRYLSMVCKQISHVTVATYINRHLMLEACWLLKTTDYSIQTISEILHFADQASFSKFFKRLRGCNPLQYRRGNEA